MLDRDTINQSEGVVCLRLIGQGIFEMVHGGVYPADR